MRHVSFLVSISKCWTCLKRASLTCYNLLSRIARIRRGNAPDPPTDTDVRQKCAGTHVWRWRWPSWASVPNSPYGLRGREATLNLNSSGTINQVPPIRVNRKEVILNCQRKMAIKGMTCLVCACWLANRVCHSRVGGMLISTAKSWKSSVPYLAQSDACLLNSRPRRPCSPLVERAGLGRWRWRGKQMARGSQVKEMWFLAASFKGDPTSSVSYWPIIILAA